ncbi:MAG: tetratricopeptide repeat protein [Chloroflexi bacterium]|nr:tetratricopeptide repeat protein [Chloroflexota bacterium]
MQCPKCNTENLEGAKFCLNCGAKLVTTCSQCGSELPLQARFCFVCGTLVSAPPSEAAREPGAVGLTEALKRLVPKEFAERLLATRGKVGSERRMVTILFSDVKGSTAMAEKLDPEEVMEIMNGAFEFLIPPVYRYEGTLARLMGDAILAFFGAPIAHEDDPERACRAALEIIEGAGRYAARLERERGIRGFNVRVGINTGLVVVGEVGSDLRVEYTAMGDVVNLAARMEGAAEPGTILITEETHKLIAPLFEAEFLGPIQVKGRTEPVATYRVLAAKEVAGKVRGIAGLESPLVGREAEFGALGEAVERLRVGVGGVVTIVGEAGIGKSRLVAELRKQASADLQWVEGRCLSYGTSIAYLLWLDVLRGLLGVTAEATPLAVRDVLRERIQSLCPQRFTEVYPYLARLMSLPLDEEAESALRGLAGEQLKQATFRAVETLIECAASDRPLVLVGEDMHWSDPTSLELLETLLALTDRAPLLFIFLFRPLIEHGSWRVKESATRLYRHRHTDLWLGPLSAGESERLVGNLLGVEGLPQKLKWRILSDTEGNPFYVEEVLRSLIDDGAIVRDEASGRWQATREVADIPIPDTLQGVLMARIDRLQEETKRVLQMASVIGRIFLYKVLAAIAEEERELNKHLVTLQREEMIRERARIPELEYIFKHHLTQEAAYNGLLKKQRRVFHRQVAETLEQMFPERIEEQVGLLAHHWERAGEPQKAIHYLLQAGQKAVRVSANQEAIAHFTKGLELLQTLPDTSQRAQQEFVLQLALSAPLIATRGWGAPEVGLACRRARELSRQMGQLPQLPSLLNLLYQFYLIRAEHETALDLAKEIVAVAERGQDPLQIAFPLGSLGTSSFYIGDFTSARACQEQLIASYDPELHRSMAFVYGQDLAVLHMGYLARTTWFLGYPDRAVELNREAIARAQGLDHPFSLALAFSMACWTHTERREVAATEERAEAAIRIAAPRGFVFFESMGLCFQGWVRIQEGAIEEGMAQIRQSVAGLRAMGSEFHHPHFLSWLAEGHAKAGQVEEGIARLAEALELVERTGERYYEAEIHRLKGDLLWMQGNGPEAEAEYDKAIQVARQQSTKSLELRATMSLSRLLQTQGKQEQARQLLAEIYSWFTEGFDTPDLKEAKALLEELL